jgi:hypothetical protein
MKLGLQNALLPSGVLSILFIYSTILSVTEIIRRRRTVLLMKDELLRMWKVAVSLF